MRLRVRGLSFMLHQARAHTPHERERVPAARASLAPFRVPAARASLAPFRGISAFPLVRGSFGSVTRYPVPSSPHARQIRHMIGGGVAVARGQLPLPLLAASLSEPARVGVPRAPPHSLLLLDCSFPPFRKVRVVLRECRCITS